MVWINACNAGIECLGCYGNIGCCDLTSRSVICIIKMAGIIGKNIKTNSIGVAANICSVVRGGDGFTQRDVAVSTAVA